MRFALTDDQVAFRDAVRDLLAKECAPEVVRAAWSDGPRERDLWDALVDMGVTSILVPESSGGLGLDAVTAVAVLVETGRAAVPWPVVDTAMVAAPVIGGDRMAAADLDGAGIVPYAQEADVQLVAAGDGLFAAPPVAGGDAVVTIDRSRRAGRVNPSTATMELVTSDPVVIEAARDRAALGTAAELVGLGERMLSMTVEYVKQRQQFGAPIGSFQAVKHHLANALKDLSFARPSVFAAAWALDAGAPAASRDVSMAKALASDAAQLTGRVALQCHGAIGYTVEYDLHLFMKRAWALARAHGDAARHRDRVGQALGV